MKCTPCSTTLSVTMCVWFVSLCILAQIACGFKPDGMNSRKPQQLSSPGVRREKAFVTRYAPSSTPTSSPAKMFKKTPPPPRSERPHHSNVSNKRRGSVKLSHSVLADCDTLPDFPTAHGLLSPETVMRMEEMTSNNGQRNEALSYFFDKYRRNGPMSCLPLLSDPDVLPHLTVAMRDSL